MQFVTQTRPSKHVVQLSTLIALNIVFYYSNKIIISFKYSMQK